MGMVASLEQITSQQLAEFLQDPQRAYDYVFSQLLEDPASMNFFDEILRQAEGNAGQIPGLRAQIERIQGQAHALKTRAGIHLVKGRRKPSEQTQVKQERKQFSLEKDWHVLHYLLNGTAEGGDGPLADAVLGGAEIPDVDGLMGYGPSRYLTPEQVNGIATALAAVTLKQLSARFDQKDAIAKQIYLADTLSSLSDWSYFAEFFESFKNFYQDAARHGNAMLLQIT